MAWSRSLWCVLVASGLGLACGGSPHPATCQADLDCPTGSACVAGQCQAGLTVAITSPAAAVTATNGIVAVQVAVSGGEAAAVDLLRDGAQLARIASPYVFSWDTSQEIEGSHELRARVTAGSRNYDSVPKTVVVDRTPPAAPHVDPPSPTGTASVHVTGTAEAGASVALTYGAGQVATTTAGSGGTWGVDLTLAAGTYSLTATATDAAGNVSSASAAASLVVDPTRPAIVSRQPPPGTTDYDVQQPIAVAFSKPIAATSVTAASVTLALGGVPLAIDRQLSADHKTLTLVPVSPLAVPADVAVVLTADLHDDSGNALLVPSGTWTFSAPAWLPVGTGDPVRATPGDSALGGLAVDAQGSLYLAATETPSGGGTGKIYVLKWNGTSWAPLGGFLNVDGSQSASEACLALGANGLPVVAWVEFTPTPTLHSVVYVKQWTGTAWTSLGGSLTVGPATATPTGVAVAVDGSGNVLVGWNEYPNGPDPANAYVRRWSGSAWTLLGGGPVSTTTFGYGKVTLAAAGTTPYVAFQEGTTAGGGFANFSRVRAFTGAVWQDVGGPPTIETFATAHGWQALAMAGNNPVLSFSEATATSNWVRASGWTGSSWQAFAGPLNRDTSQPGYYPSVAVASGGRPVVAWMEYPHPKVVHVSAWSGSAWTPLGGSLDLGGDTYQPLVVIGPRGAPIVAWSESFSTSGNTYVRRYNQ